MTGIEALLAEYDQEMANTRRILERIPDDRFAWTPHEKSAPLGRLANHLAAMPAFVAAVINGMAKKMPETASTAELLRALDANIATGRAALAASTDEHLAAALPAIKMTRAAVLRNRVLSHLIHHRGQLSVYLRLLGVPVPGMYGESADEKIIS